MWHEWRLFGRLTHLERLPRGRSNEATVSMEETMHLSRATEKAIRLARKVGTSMAVVHCGRGEYTVKRTSLAAFSDHDAVRRIVHPDGAYNVGPTMGYDPSACSVTVKTKNDYESRQDNQNRRRQGRAEMGLVARLPPPL